MTSNNQSYSFCGVGALWQNGSIESYIGHLTAKARSMLLHAMHKWPNVVTSEFWPFAFKQAAKLHNVTPTRGSNQSPHEIFTNEDNTLSPTDFRTLFCPVLVLEKELQDGNTIPKFSKNRSHIGVYVGHSPHHAGSVALVLNINTLVIIFTSS